jgi:hypothetical protein
MFGSIRAGTGLRLKRPALSISASLILQFQWSILHRVCNLVSPYLDSQSKSKAAETGLWTPCPH